MNTQPRNYEEAMVALRECQRDRDALREEIYELNEKIEDMQSEIYDLVETNDCLLD